MEQIIDLNNRGYLGSHCKSHIPIENSEVEQIKNEISGSLNDLKLIAKKKIFSISYPHGLRIPFSDNIFSICKQSNIVSGFTMNSGLNTTEDILKNPFFLKRFDTNNVYGGKTESNLLI